MRKIKFLLKTRFEQFLCTLCRNRRGHQGLWICQCSRCILRCAWPWTARWNLEKKLFKLIIFLLLKKKIEKK